MRRPEVPSGWHTRPMNLVPLLSPSVAAAIGSWNDDDRVRRIWHGDPTVFSDDPGLPDLANRLGWIDLHATMRPHLAEIERVAGELIPTADHVVLCGMGGSSLAPEVFGTTFGRSPGHPELIVLDSTHPEAVLDVRSRIDPHRTVFVVSSKSGGTLETTSFFRYFWAESEERGDRFVAITDPGTSLARLAEERRFHHVFTANPDVGGRFSALTHFGLVPAALIGADVAGLLDGAASLASQAGDNVRDDPAVGLGLALAALVRRGMDKLTVLTSPGVASLPGWMEQLIAESLGKRGTGVVPVADEPLAPPGTYGRDRVFVSYVLAGERGPDLEAFIRAGHPAIGFELPSPSSLGYEMLRAEMMTAVIGAELRVNPFDQPDVEAAKVGAKRAMAGELDLSSVPTVPAAEAVDPLEGLLESVTAGDYVGIHAYLAPTHETWARLTELRAAIGARTGVATTLGWGPRFLHSTGQLHKGGPNTGAFIQLVDTPDVSVPVPETDHGFESIISAQAAGDHVALREAGRRVLRIDLGSDRRDSLSRLVAAIR